MTGNHKADDERRPTAPPRHYYRPWECIYSLDSLRIRLRSPRIRFGLRTLFAVTTVAAVGSCCLGVLSRSVEGRHLSADEANRRLQTVGSPCRVPDGATDVNVRASFLHAIVSFDLSFPEFDRYCVKRGWHLRPIDPNSLETMYDTDYKSVAITSGYCYRGSTHRGGYDAYYDLSSRRAWIHYAHH